MYIYKYINLSLASICANDIGEACDPRPWTASSCRQILLKLLYARQLCGWKAQASVTCQEVMRLGWPVGSTDDEGILAWMVACRKRSLALRYKPPR